MTINTIYSASDVNSDLFAALRGFETGSGDPGAAVYGGTIGSGATEDYGAYSEQAPALVYGQDISTAANINTPSDWIGNAGRSLSAFLVTRSNEDQAVADNFDNYLIPTINRNTPNAVGSTFVDTVNGGSHSITLTETGLLLTGWLGPYFAVYFADPKDYLSSMPPGGTMPGGHYEDSIIRLEVGEILEGITPSFTVDPKASQYATYINEYETHLTNSVIHVASNTIQGNISTAGQTNSISVTLDPGFSYEFNLYAAPNSGDTLVQGKVAVQDFGYNTTQTSSSSPARETVINPGANAINTTLQISSFVNNGTGSYTLVAAAPDDFSANTSTTGKVVISGTTGSATGTISTHDDIDWFKTTLTAGHYYTFELDGASTNGGTLAQTYLHMYGPSGTSTVTRDSTATTGAIYNTQTAATAGVYYLGAQSNNNGYGTYTLHVTDDGTSPKAPDSVQPNETASADTVQTQALVKASSATLTSAPPSFTDMQQDLLSHTGGSAILAYQTALLLEHVHFGAADAAGSAAHVTDGHLPGFVLEPTFEASIAHLNLMHDTMAHAA